MALEGVSLSISLVILFESWEKTMLRLRLIKQKKMKNRTFFI